MIIEYKAWITYFKPGVGTVREFCQVIHSIEETKDGFKTTKLEFKPIEKTNG